MVIDDDGIKRCVHHWHFDDQPSPAPATPAQDEAQNLRYAEQLTVSLARKHYPEVPQFEPLSGDMFGLLSQIDNMTTGMMRATPAAAQTPKPLVDDVTLGMSLEGYPEGSNAKLIALELQQWRKWNAAALTFDEWWDETSCYWNITNAGDHYELWPK
jgi:hypothetical protein